MIILDYTGKNITFQEFLKLINDTRKLHRQDWYSFNGYVNGKQVAVKGFGTWLQQYIVGEVNTSSGMEISVKQFNERLNSPFKNSGN